MTDRVTLFSLNLGDAARLALSTRNLYDVMPADKALYLFGYKPQANTGLANVDQVWQPSYSSSTQIRKRIALSFTLRVSWHILFMAKISVDCATESKTRLCDGSRWSESFIWQPLDWVCSWTLRAASGLCLDWSQTDHQWVWCCATRLAFAVGSYIIEDLLSSWLIRSALLVIHLTADLMKLFARALPQQMFLISVDHHSLVILVWWAFMKRYHSHKHTQELGLYQSGLLRWGYNIVLRQDVCNRM